MNADALYSFAIKIVGLAIFFFVFDAVFTRGFDRLYATIERSRIDRDAALRWVKYIILFIVLSLVGVVYAINLPPRDPDLAQIQLTQEVGVSLLVSPIPNPPANGQDLEIVPSISSIPAEAILPSPTFTPTPTFTPIPEKRPKVVASRTTEDELEAIESIWIAKNIDAFIVPGLFNQTFPTSVRSSERFRWPFFWCATDNELLMDNLSAMSVYFTIDEKTLAPDKIYEYEGDRGKSKCFFWSTTLSDWLLGSNLKLVITMALSRDIYNGKTIIPAGDYILELNVTVK